MMGITVEAGRYHDFSAGHRVAGHESKCALLHGHNYRVHFDCQPSFRPDQRTYGLDSVGRVLDFSSINALLCQWLEQYWDHKFLAWEGDLLVKAIAKDIDTMWGTGMEHENMFRNSIVWLPFNPTAENMAAYLLRTVAPQQLQGSGVYCRSVTVWETRKCYAIARMDDE